MAQYIGEIGSTDAQSVADMLQTFGQIERDRRERQLTDTIVTGLSAGKDFDAILADVQNSYNNPQMGGGIPGFFQGVASRFMPASRTMQILAGMGLSQATPQARAELEGTQALTKQRRTQTRATKQGMRRAQAHEQLDLEAAQTDLRKSRQQLAELKRANDPAFQEYDHYSRLAVMSLNRLRYGDLMQGDPEYQEATQQYTDALDQMQQAWQRYQNRAGKTAPGEAPAQSPAGAAPQSRVTVDDAVAWSLADPQRAQAYWSDVLAKQGYGERDIQDFSQILATGDRARIQAALSRIRIE